MSWAISKHKRTTSGGRYLLTGMDSNRLPAWYLLDVPALRCLVFERAVKTPPIDLEEYGTILDSGYGPPPENMGELASA